MQQISRFNKMKTLHLDCKSTQSATFSRMRIVLLLTFLWSSVLGQSKEEIAHQRAVEGIKALDEGNHPLAIKLLKQARDLQPYEYDYTLEIGKAYLKAGSPKRAEKYLFELQYHQNVEEDLYILLADCYKDVNSAKPAPDETRKKELNALRYGVQRLPSAGKLYLELGKRNLEMEKTSEALVSFESGLKNVPNFAENYFWAAKLMKASKNALWTWFYAEICFSMTDDPEVARSCAFLIAESLQTITKEGWKAEPTKTELDFQLTVESQCKAESTGSIEGQVAFRKCILNNWKYELSEASELFDRMKALEQDARLEPLVASLLETTDKEAFLKWLAGNGKAYDSYRTWRYWNPLKLSKPINRLAE